MMKKAITLALCALMVAGCFAFTSCNKDDGGKQNDGTSASAGSENGENAGDTSAAKEIKDVPCKDIVDALAEKFKDVIPAAGGYYFMGADELSDNFVEPETMNMWYHGAWDTFAEYDYFADYAVRLPQGQSAFELHVFKVKDAANINAVLEMCKSRIEIQTNNSDLKLYAPEAYNQVIPNATAYAEGNYVFLVITTDTAAAKDAINSVIYDN